MASLPKRGANDHGSTGQDRRGHGNRRHGTGATGSRLGRGAQRLTTETKSFFKTSEFWTFAAVLAGILIAGNTIESDGGRDYFNAAQVWLYATILTLGYLLSRGIAKSGSRDPYWDSADRDDNGR